MVREVPAIESRRDVLQADIDTDRRALAGRECDQFVCANFFIPTYYYYLRQSPSHGRLQGLASPTYRS